jgi:uncharacterized surface protein with fasciclin (FAS1) repeats
MNMKNIKFIRPLFAIVLILALTRCQDSKWDDYYSSMSFDKTLMQTIDEHPELSTFASIIRNNGLESLLSSSQSLTVFAPTNDALSTYSENSNTLNQFLYNHICRYLYTMGDVADTDDGVVRMKMLNGKYNNLSLDQSGLLVGDLTNVISSQGASNGVLNIISNVLPFRNNIYEEICQNDNSTDSIASYLTAYDQYIFLPDKSDVIGTNDQGQTLYDSVFNFRNNWMTHFGYINLEDSVYTMLVPSNSAWSKQYEKISQCFRTYGEGELKVPVSGLNITGQFETTGTVADSLQREHTYEAMTQDLVFRKVVDVNHFDGDSLTSIHGNVFHSPARLFEGSRECNVSNGLMYVTDSLKFEPSESWHKEIRVEAENSTNFATQYVGSTSVGSVINYPQYAGKVSENGFLIVNPTQLSFQRTTVRFRLPSTLAAKYNIYIVTVPASAQDTSLIGSEKLLNTRLKFYLRYVHEDGRLKEDAALVTPVDYDGTQTPTPIDESKPAFITDAQHVNKMLIAKNFRFPYANYTSSVFQSSSTSTPTTAFLRVESDVTKAADLSVFEKTMRIDCIILEPVD